MSSITTHILDVSNGSPAREVPVILERQIAEDGWQIIGAGQTDDDGRLRDILPADETLAVGEYRLTFDTKTYFERQNIENFYPQVVVVFTVRSASQHYHVPLLLSPFGYSTYRGS